jgi:hypothetical protein
LGNENEAPSLRENRDVSKKEAKDAFSLVCEHQEKLLKMWEKIYGKVGN